MNSRIKKTKVEILIAEDSATQREQLAHLLEEHDFSVRAAANGAEALAMAKQQAPSMIISDVVMPELDGYGLAKAIRSDEQLKGIPIILVTTLSDPQDVILGLECGADNFIRKPYEERYLISRIEYLLMNLELRQNQRMQMGVEIKLGGQRHFITADRQQILDLLISTYEQAIHINEELKLRENELAHSNDVLNGLYHIAEGLNQADNEQSVAELALDRALRLPWVLAGWIALRENDTDFRILATRNLPPALEIPGALEGNCQCRQRLLSGELVQVTNMMECERLNKAQGDKGGLNYHAAVPLWLGDRVLGIMNLAGPDQGLFGEDALKILYGVGNQVAVAMERARLHGHLEKLVEERTAALTAEIEERKKVEGEQARLVAIINATPDMVATANIDGKILFFNQAGLRMTGYESVQEMANVRIAETHPEWAAKLVMETAIPYAIAHGAWSGETMLRRRDGKEIPISQVIIAHKGASNEIEYLSTIARDITERKEQENRTLRLNRVYSVLSGINTTIARISNKQELLDEACRIAVDHGQFRMAWIGLLDADRAKLIPAARAGYEDGYLDGVLMTIQENGLNNLTVASKALSEKKPVMLNDINEITGDEKIIPWKEGALQRGYRSMVAFPLMISEKPVGTFTLYASEPGFFDHEEMTLLAELAADVSFALDHIEKEAQLDYLAYYDMVTGLPNHILFNDRLNQSLKSAKKQGVRLALLVVDLDRFHVINESMGRHGADALLKQVAGRLTTSGLDENYLAYLGSGNFGLILNNLQNEEDVIHMLEKQVADILNSPFNINENEFRLSAKAGIAIFPDDGMEPDILFRNAEAALKNANQSGEKYQFYAPEFNRRVAENLSLENKLRRALEKDELVLHYQPKVDLKKGTVCGLEALLRWTDPDDGPVPPVKFIPILEETGLILEAGRRALERAVADFQQWKTAGLQPPRIAVNVSAIQLRRKDFVDTVSGILAHVEKLDGVLELEITESLIMQDIESNIQKLLAIRDMGVSVAIDDFGTGYSSLSYIARLPINALKIDRAFIMNLTSNPDDLSIVSTIITLAHSLEYKVVAEGVETTEQANLLRLLKCDEMQGYLVSPALSPEKTGASLKEKAVSEIP